MWVLSWCREERYFLQLEKLRGKRGRRKVCERNNKNTTSFLVLISLSLYPRNAVIFCNPLYCWFSPPGLLILHCLSPLIFKSSPGRTINLIFLWKKQSFWVILWLRWSTLLNSTDKFFLWICCYWNFAWSPFFTSDYGNTLGGTKLVVQIYWWWIYTLHWPSFSRQLGRK